MYSQNLPRLLRRLSICFALGASLSDSGGTKHTGTGLAPPNGTQEHLRRDQSYTQFNLSRVSSHDANLEHAGRVGRHTSLLGVDLSIRTHGGTDRGIRSGADHTVGNRPVFFGNEKTRADQSDLGADHVPATKDLVRIQKFDRQYRITKAKDGTRLL